MRDTTLAELEKFWTDVYQPAGEELERIISGAIARFKGSKTPVERAQNLPGDEYILEQMLDKLIKTEGHIGAIDMTKLKLLGSVIIGKYISLYPNAFVDKNI